MGVELKCPLDSGAEASWTDHKLLILLDPKCHVLEKTKTHSCWSKELRFSGLVRCMLPSRVSSQSFLLSLNIWWTKWRYLRSSMSDCVFQGHRRASEQICYAFWTLGEIEVEQRTIIESGLSFYNSISMLKTDIIRYFVNKSSVLAIGKWLQIYYLFKTR